MLVILVGKRHFDKVHLGHSVLMDNFYTSFGLERKLIGCKSKFTGIKKRVRKNKFLNFITLVQKNHNKILDFSKNFAAKTIEFA